MMIPAPENRPSWLACVIAFIAGWIAYYVIMTAIKYVINTNI